VVFGHLTAGTYYVILKYRRFFIDNLQSIVALGKQRLVFHQKQEKTNRRCHNENIWKTIDAVSKRLGKQMMMLLRKQKENNGYCLDEITRGNK
jgi:hypothetical protein